MPQERTQERIVEETMEVLFSRVEETVEDVKHVPQERVQWNTVERIVAVPVPQVPEEKQVNQIILQGPISDRVSEQSAERKDDHKKLYKQFEKCRKFGINEDSTNRTQIAELLDLVMKCLEMFAEVGEKKDDYEKFHEQSGKCLKLGIHEGSTNRAKVAELLRFNTSRSGDEQTNVKEYMDRMKEGQNDIHSITGASNAVVSSLPFVEFFRKKGPEVLHVVNPTDVFAVQRPREFDGKKLESTAKDGFDLRDDDDENMLEELKAEFKPLMKLMKEVVGDKVEKVIVSDRIVDLPWVLTTSECGWSAHLERIAQQPNSSKQQLQGAR